MKDPQVSLRLAILLNGAPVAWTDIPASAFEGKTDFEKTVILGNAMTDVALKLEDAAKPKVEAPASEIVVP